MNDPSSTIEFDLDDGQVTEVAEAFATRVISLDAPTRVHQAKNEGLDTPALPRSPLPQTPRRPRSGARTGRRSRVPGKLRLLLPAALFALLAVGGAATHVVMSRLSLPPSKAPSLDPQVADAAALRTALEEVRAQDRAGALFTLEGRSGPEIDRARDELARQIEEQSRPASPPAQASGVPGAVPHARTGRGASSARGRRTVAAQSESLALARYKAGDLAGALSALGEGRNSKLGLEIRERLVVAHLAAARQAGDAASAYLHWSRVRELAPQNAEARTQLENLRTQARQLYLSAYVEREADPSSAARKFREVLARTPAGDETHEKARRWLDRLDGASHASTEPTTPSERGTSPPPEPDR